MVEAPTLFAIVSEILVRDVLAGESCRRLRLSFEENALCGAYRVVSVTDTQMPVEAVDSIAVRSRYLN